MFKPPVAYSPRTLAASGDVYEIPVNPNAFEHQVGIAAGTATAGTVALTGKPVGMPGFETIYDSAGVAISFDLTAQETILVSGYYSAIKVEPSGANGTFVASVIDRFE